MTPEFIPHIETAKDREGKSKRIYLALIPTDTKPLETIQQVLSPVISPNPPSKFHLTLFHFGRPEELYGEIKTQDPQLPMDLFWKKFLHLLLTISVPESSLFTLQGKGIETFEAEGNSFVVIFFKKTSELSSIRGRILFSLQSFLKECGVRSPEEFMGGSKNLQFQTEPNYKPHVTLGTLLSKTQVPAVNQSMPAITFTGARIFNVKIVY